MGFWMYVGLYLFMTALGLVLSPRPRRGAPQPSSRGDFQNPTAEEGRAVQYAVGAVLIEGPNVLWYGDYEAQAIVEGGETVGYKYLMGLMWGLCLGKIDRLLDLRFDEKILTLAPFDVVAGKVLRVEAAAVGYDVAIPSGEFATANAFAKAVTTAIRGATGDPNVRVVYGYEVVEGDQIRFRVGIQTRTEALRGGVYSGAEMAATLNTAFRQLPSPPSDFPSASYDDGTGEFTIDEPSSFGGGSAEVLASGTTVLAMLGFSDLVDIPLPATGLETRTDRFFFFLPAGVEIHWTHASTNCHALFGMSPVAPDMLSSSVADAAVATATPVATYNDFGEGARVVFAAPDLFGGQASEGGIEGVLDVYYGGETQVADDYLEAQWGTTPPAFRGLCYAVARKLYWGTAPYLKNISFVAERCPNSLGLTGDRHRIQIGGGALGDDANPACVLYELLTDDRWGMGISPALLDAGSFRAAGETLWAEGLGVSLIVDRVASALDLLDELRRHIDGVIYPEPESGLLTLALVRPDYDVDLLPVFGEADGSVLSVKLARSAWEETRNVIKIQYVDRTLNHTPRVLQIQNLANIQMLGRQVVEEIPFKGISNAATAQLVGERALRTISYPLGRLELEMSRAAWRLRPGSVFRLDWPALGIEGLVCRASRVGDGEIRDNVITVEAAEDIYGLDRATFIPFS